MNCNNLQVISDNSKLFGVVNGCTIRSVNDDTYEYFYMNISISQNEVFKY